MYYKQILVGYISSSVQQTQACTLQ